MKPSELQVAKTRMISEHLVGRGITDNRVIDAFSKIPREIFVPEHLRHLAYEDSPLPIGENQTISQPFIVALMCQLLELKGDETVLDIGTGSGYQAAILSCLAKEVVTVERFEGLVKVAKNNLKEIKIKNVKLVLGDGTEGYPKKAPYDAIKSAAAGSKIPQKWIDQLKTGGRIVAPVSIGVIQNLVRIIKTRDGIFREDWGPVKFVPLIREENITL